MTQWRFTSYGAHALLPARVVHSPSPAIQVRSGVPFAEMTSYELLRLLSEGGWEWQRKPRGKPPAYSPGSQKLFYTSSLELPHAYAHCLLQAEMVFGFGTASIEHFKRAAYYKSLLQPPGEACDLQPGPGPCLEDDVRMGIEDGAEEIVEADDIRPDGLVTAELSSQDSDDSEGDDTSGQEASGDAQVDEVLSELACPEAHLGGHYPRSPPLCKAFAVVCSLASFCTLCALPYSGLCSCGPMLVVGP